MMKDEKNIRVQIEHFCKDSAHCRLGELRFYQIEYLSTWISLGLKRYVSPASIYKIIQNMTGHLSTKKNTLELIRKLKQNEKDRIEHFKNGGE